METTLKEFAIGMLVIITCPLWGVLLIGALAIELIGGIGRHVLRVRNGS